MEDVIVAMPWANTVDVVTIPGSAIKSILEHAVSDYDAADPDPGGTFVQVKGCLFACALNLDVLCKHPCRSIISPPPPPPAPQISGLVVTFDMRNDPGSRLVRAKLGRPEDPGGFRDVDDDQDYEVAMLSFMVAGGDGYSMIPDNLRAHRNTGFLDGDLIVQYLRVHNPVQAPTPGRIVILNAADASHTPSSASYPSLSSSWLYLAMLAVGELLLRLA